MTTGRLIMVNYNANLITLRQSPFQRHEAYQYRPALTPDSAGLPDSESAV